MIKEFILPDIGEGIVECEIVEWLAKEGEIIEEDQVVVEIMTDKAVVQIPSAHSGKLVKFFYQPGEIAKVHTPLFSIEIEQNPEETAASQPSPHKQEIAPLVSVSEEISEKVEKILQKKALATPAVRRLARELSIDLTQVPGSGKGGRILKEDLQKFSTKASPLAITELSASPPLQRHVEPLKGVKLAMARRMADSASTIPHFGYGDEIDLTELMGLRNDLRAQLPDVKLTLMPFFMKALTLAIREYPILNSQLNPEVTEIHYQSNCNIGMAVDTPMGLLVPNIKNVQNLTILEIAQETQQLTDAAREGKLQPPDMQGGTITISNIGAIGGLQGIPIINKPEVAVVALGKTRPLPRFNAEGAIESRQILQATWSADHRLIDGGTIVRFCNLWKQYLETPSLMLIHLS